MTGRENHAWILGVVVALGVTWGCAKNSKGSKNPQECMRTCDQEQCEFHASSVGDNGEYLECLEACEDRCSR